MSPKLDSFIVLYLAHLSFFNISMQTKKKPIKWCGQISIPSFVVYTLANDHCIEVLSVVLNQHVASTDQEEEHHEIIFKLIFVILNFLRETICIRT